MLVPCTPSGLDLEATIRALEIVDAVRVPPHGVPRLILVPKKRAVLLRFAAKKGAN
jgi:hypothetical protein